MADLVNRYQPAKRPRLASPTGVGEAPRAVVGPPQAESDIKGPSYETRTYTAQRILGKGSFGVVYQAQVTETQEIVAIKNIQMQERDREVQILKELKGHPNIVQLKGAFLSSDSSKAGPHRLNLVLEFLSDTLHRVIKHYNQKKQKMDDSYVKLYSYQLLRGLAFCHGRGIVHCDIKPQNLLLEGVSHKLKICDFGTAQRVVFGEVKRPYVCSRYYRAPECILGCASFTTAIDLWAAGCVIAEMILGQPLFTGKDGINQLVEIIKVLGTPTRQELKAMNPGFPDYEFTPKLQGHDWGKVLRWASQEALALVPKLLRFDPGARIPPLYALLDPFFDDLRNEEKPEFKFLFDFRQDELWWLPLKERKRLEPKRPLSRVPAPGS